MFTICLLRFCFVQNLQAYFCQCFLGRFLSRRIRISICWYYCNMISPKVFPITVLWRYQTAQKIRNTFEETANSRHKPKEGHWRLGASSRSTNPLSDVQHEFHHHVWVPYTHAMFDYRRNCFTLWWLTQPIETYAQVKLDHFPKVGLKITHVSKFQTTTHLVSHSFLLGKSTELLGLLKRSSGVST